MKLKLTLYSIMMTTILSGLFCKKDIRMDESLKKQGYAWAGSPQGLQTSPHEYFYLKRTEYIKEKILDKKNGELIKKTCINQSIENAKPIILEAMITSSIPKAKDRTPFRFIQEQNLFRELDYDYKEIKPQVLKCEPATYSPDKIPGGEYEICECIVYLQHKGGSDDIEKKFDKLWRIMDEKDWKE